MTDTEVTALLERRTQAMQAKDLDGLMAFYTPQAVYYDAVAPLRFVGTDALRGNFARWFAGYAGDIELETFELSVSVDGDVAFANMLHRDTGERPGGFQQSIWVRETVCLRRTGDAWAIVHEHVSIPIDPATLQAWLPADKDEAA